MTVPPLAVCPMTDELAGPCIMGEFYGPQRAVCWSHQGSGAYAAYWDADRGLNFVWDGEANHIEVEVGGAGEPVWFHIPVEPTGGKVHLPGFRRALEAWLEQYPDLDERAVHELRLAT